MTNLGNPEPLQDRYKTLYGDAIQATPEFQILDRRQRKIQRVLVTQPMQSTTFRFGADGTRRGGAQATEHFKQGGLARTIASPQMDHLSRIKREAQVTNQWPVAARHGQGFDFKNGHAGRNQCYFNKKGA